MSDGIKNSIGPYMYADGALRRRKVGKIEYLIGIAGAYNAFGLIGPEHNGIFVLDNTHKRVVLDRHCENSQGGYHGPNKAQWSELERIMNEGPRGFNDFIRTHPRNRLTRKNT
jgi:hypothetical protein